MTLLVAISVRVVYFMGTVFGLLMIVLLRVPLWVFEVEFWLSALELRLFAARVGPPLYARHKNRGRGTLAEVREKSRRKCFASGRRRRTRCRRLYEGDDPID